jgi:protein TonB
VAKPLMARAGRGTTTAATGNRPVEATLTKPEPLRAPESQPCPAASGMATPCSEKTVAVVDAKSNASQTASPASLQPEHAVKSPATGVDFLASAPALGQAALPAIQASAPETTASATVNAPVQPAPAVATMADQSSTDTAAKTSAASPIAKTVYREDPAFPREAITEGITSGSVKARLIIAGNGTVNSVTIVESQPRRIFDKAVIRALKRWQFEPTGAPQTVETEVAFSAGN